MSYKFGTELFLVKYTNSENEIIMSKREIQDLYRHGDYFETLKIRRLVLIKQELVANVELASEKFIKKLLEKEIDKEVKAWYNEHVKRRR